MPLPTDLGPTDEAPALPLFDHKIRCISTSDDETAFVVLAQDGSEIGKLTIHDMPEVKALIGQTYEAIIG